jgi:anti-sigma regulatory factor (Ser/Thr protein kinase)
MKQAMQTTFNKDIPSKRSEVKRILLEAMEFYNGLKMVGIALPVDEFYFRLALDELLENALSHGNRHDESKRIGLAISIVGDGVNISVRDEGSGFHPGLVENPTCAQAIFRKSGRGLHLLRNIGDVTWNDRGNEVKFRVK